MCRSPINKKLQYIQKQKDEKLQNYTCTPAISFNIYMIMFCVVVMSKFD